MASIKYYHSSMLNAPILYGAAGSFINLLKACLCNGFGLKTAVSVTVLNSVATVTFDSPHSFEVDSTALLAGAGTAALNGEKTVTAITALSFSFAAPGVSDGASSGTITAKVAAAGWVTDWSSAFIGTNVAVFKSNNPFSSGAHLRVDDTGTLNARVVGYEWMADINTGIGAFPTNNIISGGGFWPKAGVVDTKPRAWTIIADDKTFYIHVNSGLTTPGISGCIYGFGDFKSLRVSDPYCAFLQAPSTDRTTLTTTEITSLDYASYTPQPGPYLPRSFSGVGGCVTANHAVIEAINGVSGAFVNPTLPMYPNGPDNSLNLTKKIVVEPGICRRGSYRGIYASAHNNHWCFNWLDKIPGQNDLINRKLLAIKCGAPAGTLSAGVVFFDITGPWE